MFPGDSVAALVTPLWRNILICQGSFGGSALMKIDLSLSEQRVFLIRLCLQQGAGWGVRARRAPPLSGAFPSTHCK